MVTWGGGGAAVRARPVRLARWERRAIDELAQQLGDCGGSLGCRLRRSRWWECPSYARAMTSMSFFGAVRVLESCNAVEHAPPERPLASAPT